jgi:hypothetical protein
MVLSTPGHQSRAALHARRKPWEASLTAGRTCRALRKSPCALSTIGVRYGCIVPQSRRLALTAYLILLDNAGHGSPTCRRRRWRLHSPRDDCGQPPNDVSAAGAEVARPLIALGAARFPTLGRLRRFGSVFTGGPEGWRRRLAGPPGQRGLLTFCGTYLALSPPLCYNAMTSIPLLRRRSGRP